VEKGKTGNPNLWVVRQGCRTAVRYHSTKEKEADDMRRRYGYQKQIMNMWGKNEKEDIRTKCVESEW
jgi:hypothetical protein